MKLKYIVALIAIVLSVTLFFSCKKESNKSTEADKPSVQTLSVSVLSYNKLLIKGHVETRGNKIADYGFYYKVGDNAKNTFKVSLGNNVTSGEFSKVVERNIASDEKVVAYAYISYEKGTLTGDNLQVTMPPAASAITTIVPMQAQMWDTVVIKGKFNPIGWFEKFEVYFDRNIKANIRGVSDTGIVVDIPSNYGANGYPVNTQSVWVYADKQLISTIYDFKYLPKVHSFYPQSGPVGTQITFGGYSLPTYNDNFDFNTVRYYFNGAETLPNVSMAGQLVHDVTVAVPANTNTTKLKVGVKIKGGMSEPEGEFTITPPVLYSIYPDKVKPGGLIGLQGSNFPWVLQPDENIYIKVGDTKIHFSRNGSGAIAVFLPEDFAPGTYTVSLTVGLHTLTAIEKLIVE